MTADDLRADVLAVCDQLEKLLGHATAGPWECNAPPTQWKCPEGNVRSLALAEMDHADDVGTTLDHFDAVLIVALRNNTAQLIAELRAATAQVQAVRELLDNALMVPQAAIKRALRTTTPTEET